MATDLDIGVLSGKTPANKTVPFFSNVTAAYPGAVGLPAPPLVG